MKKAGFLFILSLTITIHMFTQENNYLINDIANLIGLDCNEAIVRMEEIYKEAYKMEYEIVIDDNLIIFKPILDVTAFSGMGIAMYILMPDIMLIKNDEEIIISVSSENIIMHDITRLDVINELDEKTRTLAEMQIISVQIYSMTMIENDEIFNIFLNANTMNIPIKPENIEINSSQEERYVQYIWIGNNELYEYIGRKDITRIEVGFVFNKEYMRTFTKWYMIN